jgi:hypothetical protein
MNDPAGTITTVVVVIAGTTILRLVRQGKWQGQIGEVMMFAFLLLVALLFLSLMSPSLAVVLAYLGLVGAFVVNGPEIFEMVGDWGRK